MRRGLIVRGRRYYSPKLNEYVQAITRHNRFVTFRRACGSDIRLDPKNVFYLSVEDFNLCDDLATEAKMTWFCPGIDDDTGTEINFEEGSIHDKSSFRKAICDLSEGLIDEDFRQMPDPKKYNRHFREIIRGMGIYDPGDYI